MTILRSEQLACTVTDLYPNQISIEMRQEQKMRFPSSPSIDGEYEAVDSNFQVLKS